MKHRSIAIHHQGLAARIDEVLGSLGEDKFKDRNMNKIYMKRIGLNILMLSILGGCSYGIVVMVEEFLTAEGFLALLPSLVMAMMNAVIPFLFESMVRGGVFPLKFARPLPHPFWVCFISFRFARV